MTDLALRSAHELIAMMTARRDVEPRASGPLSRTGRSPGPGDQRRGHPGSGSRPGARRPGRLRAPARRELGAPARSPHDGQGLLRDRRAADDRGRRPLLRLRPEPQCRRRRSAAGSGSRRLRQDQHARVRDGLADHQCALWHDEQSVESVAVPGRIVGRIGGCVGRGLHPPRAGQRHRRLHPDSLALLWPVRAQAHLGDRLTARPHPRSRRLPDRYRHQRRGAAGAERRRSRPGTRRPCRPGSGSRPGLEAAATAAPPEIPGGLPRGRLARRPGVALVEPLWE